MHKPQQKNNTARICAVSFIVGSANVLGAIREIASIEQARPYAFEKPKTLVCLDVDGTLIRPKISGPGNPRWQRTLADYAKRQGVHNPPHWGWPENEPVFERIEDAAPAFVRELQANNIPTIVLTARHPEVWLATTRQLLDAGFNFSLGIFGNAHCFFMLPNSDALFTKGMLMTGDPYKHIALGSFLRVITHPVERVICIDNDHEVLAWLDQWFGLAQEIEFIGLHYQHVEAKRRKIKIPQTFKDMVAKLLIQK